jgi:hypothetical protein
MAEHRADRRIEGNFSQGWGFALFITLLAVGSYVTAGLIHKATFRSPNDVSAPYRHQDQRVEGADTAAKAPRGHGPYPQVGCRGGSALARGRVRFYPRSTMSHLPDPPFVPSPTGWTEEMEAAASRPRPSLAPRRRWRVALRVSVWSVGVTILLGTIGTLLFIHRGDAEGSARLANREVELMLERGETIAWRAPVMARHWWHFFRVTHGVLAATNRRLLYVGVPPEGIMPREPEPQLLEESSFPYDQPIDVWRGRVFLGTVQGVVIRSPRQMRTFGVVASERARLDSVLALMARYQAAIRERDESERQKAMAAAVAARRPVYHVVQRGEALELLARQYGVTVEQLEEWNHLDGPRIRIGDRLLVKPRT